MYKISVKLNGEVRPFTVSAPVLSEVERNTISTLSTYVATAEDKVIFSDFVKAVSVALRQTAIDKVVDSPDHLTALLTAPTFARLSYNVDKGTLGYKDVAGYVDINMALAEIKARNKANKDTEGYKPMVFVHGLSSKQTALVTLFSHCVCGGLTDTDKAELLRICNKAGKGAEQTALKGFYKVATAEGKPSNKAQADTLGYFYSLFNARTGNDYKAIGSYKLSEGKSVTAFDLAEKTIRTFAPKRWEYRDNEGNMTTALYALITQYINSGKELKNKGNGQTATTTLVGVAVNYGAFKELPKPSKDSKPKSKSKAKADSKPAPAPAPKAEDKPADTTDNKPADK